MDAPLREQQQPSIASKHDEIDRWLRTLIGDETDGPDAKAAQDDVEETFRLPSVALLLLVGEGGVEEICGVSNQRRSLSIVWRRTEFHDNERWHCYKEKSFKITTHNIIMVLETLGTTIFSCKNSIAKANVYQDYHVVS